MRSSSSEAGSYRLFLDMDGVFCDFEKQIQGMEKDYVNGKLTKPVRTGTTLHWDAIFEQDPDFFARMDWMPGAEILWSKVLDYLEDIGQTNPIFLTGCPKNSQNLLYSEAVKGKQDWVKQNILGKQFKNIVSLVLTPSESDHKKCRDDLEELVASAKENDILMIFCRPEQKQFFNQPLKNNRTPVLLDDRLQTKEEWQGENKKGGIFLHHQINPKQTTPQQKNAVISTIVGLTNVGFTKPFTGGKKQSRKSKVKAKAKAKQTKKRTLSNTWRRG